MKVIGPGDSDAELDACNGADGAGKAEDKADGDAAAPMEEDTAAMDGAGDTTMADAAEVE